MSASMFVFRHATILGLIASGMAMPQPLIRRQNMTTSFTGFTDVDVLNYALTLEHLEATFYSEGLDKFQNADFTTAGFSVAVRNRIFEVAEHERVHVEFLTTALGSAATAACNYTFPLSSVAEFLATASVLEGVGVSVYLGAARLIAKARHSAYLRDLSSESKLSPFPAAQDVPLTPNEVFTLASGLITSCPATNPKLPVKPFTALSAGAPGPAIAGQTINVTTGNTVLARGSNTAKLSAAFITAAGPVFANLTEVGDGVTFTVNIPSSGILGHSYLVLCNCAERADDQTIVAGPAIIEVSRPPVITSGFWSDSAKCLIPFIHHPAICGF
ncbi:hypothetical protein LTR10_003538 [Elasticomyces elasticus]|nr:hypothetical protein LTR10_003538 [Elasticomyces elasticus]